MLNRHSDIAIVVAHFHPDGRVARHLLEFIEFARKFVTPHIVLVSTNISEDSKLQVEEHCRVIQRDNVGYDFWSYKVGLESLPSDVSWTRWIIINSSIVIASPAVLLAQLLSRPVGYGLLGLTQSEDMAKHLQSYCVMFEGKNFLKSEILRNWWSTMRPISDRDQVIRHYEIGMTQYFERNKIPVQAIYQLTQSDKLTAIARSICENNIVFNIPATQSHFTFNLESASRFNPTHVMWDAVFSRFGVVKIEFLRKSLFSLGLMPLVTQLEGWSDVPVRELVADALL